MDLLHLTSSDTSVTFHPSIEDLWSLDTIGIRDLPHVTQDDLTIQHFTRDIRFTDGRYQVRWPWKEGLACLLPDNFGLAFG